jgi:crotonobetainyl-CoA:carnitine CoA-transferase CaiB-like acyl-CoA transferase
VRRARYDDWKNDPELNSNKKRGMQKPRIAERITQTVEQLPYDEVAERLYKALVPMRPSTRRSISSRSGR